MWRPFFWDSDFGIKNVGLQGPNSLQNLDLAEFLFFSVSSVHCAVCVLPLWWIKIIYVYIQVTTGKYLDRLVSSDWNRNVQEVRGNTAIERSRLGVCYWLLVLWAITDSSNDKVPYTGLLTWSQNFRYITLAHPSVLITSTKRTQLHPPSPTEVCDLTSILC